MRHVSGAITPRVTEYDGVFSIMLAALRPEVAAAFKQVCPDSIHAVMSVLASDAFEGRQPGTRGFGRAADYVQGRTTYHTPQDDMSQAFDFNAAATHVKLNFLIGLLVAEDVDRPVWNPGDFFGRFGLNH